MRERKEESKQTVLQHIEDYSGHNQMPNRGRGWSSRPRPKPGRAMLKRQTADVTVAGMRCDVAALLTLLAA